MKRKKATRRTTARRASSRKPLQFSFNFRRFIIIGGVVAALLVVGANFNDGRLTQSVAGVNITRPFLAESTVYWAPVEGAVSYNLYYKTESESEFTNSVSSIPANVHHYTISYLRKGVVYQYRISAVDQNGKEFWWSGTQDMPKPESM